MRSPIEILSAIFSCTVIGNSTLELKLNQHVDILELIHRLCVQTKNQQNEVLFCDTFASTLNLKGESFCTAMTNESKEKERKIFLQVPMGPNTASVGIYTICNDRKISRVFDLKQ